MKALEPGMISRLSQSLELDLPAEISLSGLKDILVRRVNYLINHDCDKLLQILYRVDVNEQLLKTNLQEASGDAGVTIAEMIIERQLQKIKTKEQFKPDDNIAEDEKW